MWCSIRILVDHKRRSWRNTLHFAENTQTTEGHCGGYPGFCYPALHDSEITVKVDLYEKHPCVVSSPCFNAGICIATGLDQFFCRCHKGTSGTFCELVEREQIPCLLQLLSRCFSVNGLSQGWANYGPRAACDPPALAETPIRMYNFMKHLLFS